MYFFSRCLAVMFLFATISIVHAAGVEPSPSFITIPGGVADSTGKIGFVTGESGAIEAIDLENGKTLWDSKDATKPLAVVGKKLIAQASEKDKNNSVRIVVLDGAQNGKKLLESDAVSFPDWVSTGLTHGRSFASSAAFDKKDLLFKWQARAWYAGGARPTPEIEKAARKDAHGVARINLETGKVEMLDDDKVPAAETPKLPKGLENEKPTPFQVGNVFAAFVLDDKASKLNLKRWDATGKPLETVELLTGKSLSPMLSTDGRHLFVHQALVKEQLPEGDYAWWVFSLETGKQVAKLPYEGSNGPLAVVGERALFVTMAPRKGPPRPGMFEQARTLKAVELKTGKTAWEHALEPQRMLPPLP